MRRFGIRTLAWTAGTSLAATLTIACLVAVGTAFGDDAAKPAADSPDQPAPPPKPPEIKVGLLQNDAGAFPGYTLFASIFSKFTYLIDNQGKVVKQWESDVTPGQSVYLLENGNLLRPGYVREQEFGFTPGAGGKVQEFTWDGELLWDYTFATANRMQHHDICRLPNGNVVLIAWEKKTPAEVIAAGRRPQLAGDRPLQPDSLIEVKPTGKTTGEIVWEWHLWDHLIQDVDKTKANYGEVAAHPELVDINYGEGLMAAMVANKDDQDKLRSLGYLGGPPGGGPGGPRVNADWTHVNGIAYNADLDQIVVSVHAFSEIWIIDHSTTKEEAAGHTGGRQGKGGDLLYRWGNPQAYRGGSPADQKLFSQHNAHWIAQDLRGAGHLLVFNNGSRRPGGEYSAVDEVVLPVDAKGAYYREEGNAYGPDGPVWSYAAENKPEFFSFFISGAQRLPNGNTLICSGANGTVFEVTADKQVVWKYVNPSKDKPVFGPPGPGGPPGGGPPGGGPGPGGPRGFGPPPGELLPPFVADMLKLEPESKKQLGEYQANIGEKLGKILSDEQKKLLTERPGGFGPGGPPQPGQIMSPFVQARLKLTDEQKKEFAALQRGADEFLGKLLSDEQRKQLKELPGGFPFGPGGPGRGPRGPGGPGGPPPGPGAPGGFVPAGSALFRALRYAPDYPGLAGRELKPGKTVEELQPKEPAESKPDEQAK